MFLQTRQSVGDIDVHNQFCIPFIVKNNGDRKEFVLKVDAPSGVTYKKPVHAILPYETDTLQLFYAPNAKGIFDKEINIFLSSSTTPVVLRINGNVKSFSNDADIPCPAFNNTNTPANIIYTSILGLVIDSITRKPIGYAMIDAANFNQPLGTIKATNEGKFKITITPNLYSFHLNEVGYAEKNYQLYLNKNTKNILFELVPLPKLIAVQDTFPIAENPIPQHDIIFDTLVAVNMNTVPKSDWKNNYTGELTPDLYAPNNIIFLIDISGSMAGEKKLPVLKEAMNILVNQLRPIDRVSIIVYSTDAKVVYPSMLATNIDELLSIIDALHAGGLTNANKGMTLAHDVTTDNFLTDGNNQIILATDGAFKMTDDDLKQFTDDTRKINFTAIGFGEDEYSLKNLQTLSKNLDGNFIKIKNKKQANKFLLDEIKRNSVLKK